MMFGVSLLLMVASTVPPTQHGVPVESESHLIIEDRSVSCPASSNLSDESDSQPLLSAQPCDVDQWEGKITEVYPRRALEDSKEGTIRIYAMIDKDGRFSDCARNTLGNSFKLGGYTACKLLLEFGRFRPATDSSGRPISAPVTILIQYVLPPWPEDGADYTTPAKPRDLAKWSKRIAQNIPGSPIRRDFSGVVGLRVMVDQEGRAMRCEVTQSSSKPYTDEAACRGMIRYARFTPALGPDGKPTMGAYSTTITYKYD